ncbi:hypothetical protein IZU89_09915 [Cellulophaga lytica]|uniref:hypothetical protein n=1 Tax=Cellulophaga lytica TaxID=979 RepID=UPI0032E3971D
MSVAICILISPLGVKVRFKPNCFSPVFPNVAPIPTVEHFLIAVIGINVFVLTYCVLLKLGTKTFTPTES